MAWIKRILVKSHHVNLFWAVLGHFKPLCANCGRCQNRELLGERESTVFSCCARCTGSRCWCTEATGGRSGGAAQLDQTAKTRQKLDPKNSWIPATVWQILNMNQWPETEFKWICWLWLWNFEKLVRSHQVNLFLAGKPQCTVGRALCSACATSQRPCWSCLVLKTSSIFSCRLRGLLQPRELQNSVKTEWRMFY